MPYCLEDLILPSTLPETNNGLNFDTMLTKVSPVHDRELAVSCSHRPQSPSVSSSSRNSISYDFDFDLDMAFHSDEEAARQLTFSSSHQPYYSQPVAMASQHLLYTSQHTPIPSQQSWLSLPLFTQQQSSYNSALPPNGIYPSFDPAVFASGGSVIPPTPPPIGAPSFFNPHHSQSLPGYLATTPSQPASHSSYESNTTPMSSSSRSCSPIPIICTAPPTALRSSASTYAEHLTSPPQVAQAIPTCQSQTQLSSNSLHSYGIPIPSTSPTAAQTWRCAYPNCSSRALFTRGCDLRKHYNRHSKHLFCRVRGCPQSAPRNVETGVNGNFSSGNASSLGGIGLGIVGGASGGQGGGFSSKKDRARHEAKHNPRILCEWVSEGGERCGRRFSRVDNMKDHVRRIHRKGQVDGLAQSGDRQEKESEMGKDDAGVHASVLAPAAYMSD